MSWTNGLFGCFSVKDCGPMCCIGPFCCGPCIYGSAMEKAGVCDCLPACVCLYCCPICTLFKNRKDVAEKYSIEDPMLEMICGSLCCLCCGYYQIVGEVMEKEKLKWGIIAVAPE